MKRDADLFARGGLLVVAPVHREPAGQFVGGPVERLRLPVDPVVLGRSVLAALERGTTFEREPPGAERDLVSAFGVRSWRALVPGTASVAVRQTDEVFKVRPMRNLGASRGFDFLVASTVEIPWRGQPDPLRLGEGVLAAFSRSQPPLEVAGGADGPREPAGASEAERPVQAGDVREAAEQAAALLRWHGYRADRSLESLRDLDRFFDAESQGALTEHTGQKLFAVTSYVGETLERCLGASWRLSGGGEDPAALAMVLPDGSVIWPGQRVVARLQVGPDASLAAYAAALSRPHE